jgi:hypothetical protein
MKLPKYTLRTVVVLAVLALALVSVKAQFFRGRRFRSLDQIPYEHQAEQAQMEKALNPEFREDTFTFARLMFAETEARGGFGGGRTYDDDAPDADLNAIYRLHLVTSLKVHPGMNIINITFKELASYPFVYLAASGRVVFTDDEVTALHNYLLNGGFLMADDFWGDAQWEHFHEQMQRILPGHEPVEIGLDHRIFHTVYDFKKEPQIPSVGSYTGYGLSYDPGWPYAEKGHEPHYFAVYDDKQRMVALICHNNHYGDGWEHEGDDTTYFDKFSEPMGYPMLLNILVYTMSH